MRTTAKAPRRPGAKSTEAMVTTTGPAQAGRIQQRQLEQSVSCTAGERLRLFWYRIRLEGQEINYASKRMIELQMRLPDDWGQRLRGQR